MGPIGVFDSGIGGLTVANAIRRLLPFEPLLYFGDTAHLPYGDKSPELLQKYITEITKFLLEKNCKAIVIACNTASAVAGELVKKLADPIPVFEVIQPVVNHAVQISQNQRIGVIGTKTTIQSHVYLKSILDRSPSAWVVEKATPILVPMIEEGWIHNEISSDIIEAYLSDTGFQHIDTLILGCTHYPLIKSEIESCFSEKLAKKTVVIDSSLVVAQEISEWLKLHNELADSQQNPIHRFYVSDLTDNFSSAAQIFFGEQILLEKATIF